MIYVGIDVASEKHDFFMMTDNGEVYKSSSITIANNETGYQSLCRAISEFCTTTNDENVRIGLESTGIYHQNILTYLVASGYEVELINPILTNMFAKSSKVHHPKTDNLDSQNICKFLIDHKADFKPYSLSLYNISELKSLERARFSVIEDLRKAKLHLYTLIKKIFPEYLKLFSNLYGITSLNILKKYPTPHFVWTYFGSLGFVSIFIPVNILLLGEFWHKKNMQKMHICAEHGKTVSLLQGNRLPGDL